MNISQLNQNQFKCTLKNKNNFNLVGNLILNTNTSSSIRKLIIICHGLLDTKESSVVQYIQDAFLNYSRDGFDIFKFDFQGNGESEGLTSYSDYPSQVEDLKVWIDAFHQRDIDLPTAEGIKTLQFSVDIVSGHSKGGTVVMLYASQYPEIDNIINISGRCQLQECSLHRFSKNQLEQLEAEGKFKWRQVASPLTPDVKRDVIVLAEDFEWRKQFNHHCYKAILNNPNRQVQTIHGTKDPVVPHADALHFDELVQPKHTLYSIQGGGHVFESEDEQTELRSYLQKCLDNIKLPVKL